jgi:hypothetical protein
MEFPTAPKTPGEKVLFAYAVAAHKDFRPAGWQATYAGLLRADPPYVREQAAFYLAKVPHKEFAAHLPKLLEDGNRAVVLAACGAVEQVKEPTAREPLAKLLKTSKDREVVKAADRAAYAVLPNLDRVQILVDRLDDPAVDYTCLECLSWVVTGWTGQSAALGGGTAADRKALKAVWQTFVKDHAADLKAGKRWQFDDPAIPVRALLPGFTFHRDDRKPGPEEKGPRMEK